ncbi:Uronate isomerase [Bienertia sinuspersici]
MASVQGCKPSHSGTKYSFSSSHVNPFIDDLPTHIVPYINNIYNVDVDGNCGYRVVARWIYGDEHRWPTVRKN